MVIALGAAEAIVSGAAKVIAVARIRRWFLRRGDAVVRATKDTYKLQEIVRLHRLGVGARELADSVRAAHAELLAALGPPPTVSEPRHAPLS